MHLYWIQQRGNFSETSLGMRISWLVRTHTCNIIPRIDPSSSYDQTTSMKTKFLGIVLFTLRQRYTRPPCLDPMFPSAPMLKFMKVSVWLIPSCLRTPKSRAIQLLSTLWWAGTVRLAPGVELRAPYFLMREANSYRARNLMYVYWGWAQ